MSLPLSSPANILVTGGAGFIGTHLCHALTARGDSVFSLDLRGEPEGVPVDGVRYYKGDVRDRNVLRPLVNQVDLVYHFAATVSVPLCQKDPVESYSNNLTATLEVLEAIRAKATSTGTAPIPLVFASSAALYGNNGDGGNPLRECDTAQTFSSFYAAQKHASEKAIELYSASCGIPSVIFRFFNVYGPGQDPASPYSGVITLFNTFAEEGRPLPLHSGGVQTRDFISVHDIVAACTKALTLPRDVWDATPVNLGSGSKITVRELASIISQLHGGRSELISAPAREGDVMHSVADISLARARFDFRPTQKLREGLEEIRNVRHHWIRGRTKSNRRSAARTEAPGISRIRFQRSRAV